MPEVKPAIETFAKIVVVGVGGAGGQAINRMIETKIRGVEFLAINTDIQALHHSQSGHKINIGKTVTRGLGAGMDPEVGRRAAEESQNEIRDFLKGSNMVFITAGMGGGTGSGATPVVAEIARELGALTVAVVTKPFTFEGAQRQTIGERAHEELAQKVDTIITIPNDRVMQTIDKKTSLKDAFKIIDDVLRQAVQGIADLIMTHGQINVDFADVRRVMASQGPALMGIGRASGDNRSIDAAKAAISSPLLEISIDGARGILFIVSGPESLGMQEVQEAAKVITGSADEGACIIWGLVTDNSLGDDVKITVIATGFEDRRARLDAEHHEEMSVFRPIARPLFSATANAAARLNQNISENVARISPQPIRPILKEREDEPLSSFQKKTLVGSAIGTTSRSAAASTSFAVDDALEEDSEVEIPAFIRKKMNVGGSN